MILHYYMILTINVVQGIFFKFGSIINHMIDRDLINYYRILSYSYCIIERDF